MSPKVIKPFAMSEDKKFKGNPGNPLDFHCFVIIFATDWRNLLVGSSPVFQTAPAPLKIYVQTTFDLKRTNMFSLFDILVD